MSSLTLDPPRASPAPGRRAAGRGALPLGLVLVLVAAVQLTVLWLGDARAYSGSDAGGKAAAVRAAAEGDGLDIGYWAEGLDPEGRFHPLVNTERIGDAWVQATSPTYTVVGVPLWRIGGATGLAMLSVASVVAAAAAAASLGRSLGGTGLGSTLTVGLASPMLVYGTDTWEHAPALACALWAVAITWRRGPTRATAFAAAGVLAGLAFVLRIETGIFVAAAALALVASRTERTRLSIRRVTAGAVGAAAIVLANAALESVLLGERYRDVRARGNVVTAGHGILDRLRDIVLTGFSPLGADGPTGLAFGLILGAGALVLAAVATGRRVPAPILRIAVVLVVGVVVARLFVGWGFVPGALAAVPLIALAVFAEGRSRSLVLAVFAALPVVWLLQWTGNHEAQWGARYLLVGSALLATVAGVALEDVRRSLSGVRRLAAGVLVGCSLAMTVLAGAWHVHRSSVVADAFEQLAERPADEVLISTDTHLLREGGAWYGDRRWLRAEIGRCLPDEALHVARQAGARRVAVVGRDEPAGEQPCSAVGQLGLRSLSVARIRYLGGDLVVESYEWSG